MSKHSTVKTVKLENKDIAKNRKKQTFAKTDGSGKNRQFSATRMLRTERRGLWDTNKVNPWTAGTMLAKVML